MVVDKCGDSRGLGFTSSSRKCSSRRKLTKKKKGRKDVKKADKEELTTCQVFVKVHVLFVAAQGWGFATNKKSVIIKNV
jgi:hypothetical protein